MNIFEKLNNFFEKHNDFDNEVIVQQISNILDEYKERPSNPHEIIELFFSSNNYYYIHTSNLYIQYKDSSYSVINENELLHKILHYLSEHRQEYVIDTHTKGLLKTKIQKIIKTRKIHESIPDSDTLQNILSFFYPNLFAEKQTSKIFF